MNTPHDLFHELQQRGFVAQTTHPEELAPLLNQHEPNKPLTIYAGFDPSADSLTMGHLLPIFLLAHFQRAGHNIIAIGGGGTMMIGDPTGKTEMRDIISPEQINKNLDKIKVQLARLLTLDGKRGHLINNADWLLPLNYMEFLRDVGVHFNVNQMLHAECFKSRMEKGLSFIELNYMILQSYDFFYLNQKYDCSVQIGGDDQWSNILFGADLIRKKSRKSAYALTIPLLTTADGIKMGKTAKGAIWLDPERTPPFEFYQYLRNVDDRDVIKYLKVLTFLPLDEIAKLEKLQGVELNEAKKILAFECSKIIHGEAVAAQVAQAAQAAFGAATDLTSLPTFELNEAALLDPCANLLTKLGIFKTTSEVRRLIEQKGLRLNKELVTTHAQLLTTADFSEGHAIIQSGKKHFYRLVLK